MRLILKCLAALLSLALLTMVGVFVYLTQVLDPNDFKADIESLAQNQGLPLKLHGQVSWQFFPQLGLRVMEVELATPGASLLKAQELSASVAVMPLLQGQVRVAGVLLKGAQVHALRGANGQANWALTQTNKAADASTHMDSSAAASPTTASAPSTTPRAADGRTQLSLAVERFVIEDAQVLLEDRQANTHNQLQGWNLTALNINFEGRPFNLQQDFVVRLDKLPALSFTSQGEVSLDASAGRLDIPSLLFNVVRLDAPAEPLQLSLSGRSALEPLAPDFHLSLSPVNAASWLSALNIELPPMAAADALTHIALEADLSGTDQAWQLSNVDVRIDKTRLQGAIGLGKDGALSLQLKGDQLNLDRYLPPVVKRDEQAPAATSSAASPLLSNDTLPLAGLKALKLNAHFTLQRLQASGLTMTDTLLHLTADDGNVQLEQLATHLYEGQLSLVGQLDARQPKAQVSAKGSLNGLSLAPLLEALEQQRGQQAAAAESEPTLAGQANIDFDLMTKGASLRDWQLGLQANAGVLADQLTVHQLDVEKGFCELAASLSGNDLVDQSWKGLTRLEDVRVDLTIAGTEVSIDQLQAGVEHIQLKGRGNSNYLKGDFDIKAEALVTGQKDASRACQLADRWRNRELPLRCVGNFDSIGARTCGPDKDRVEDLLRDEAKARVKEKVGKKVNKLEEKLKEKLGNDIGGQLLKGLFNR